MLTPPLLILYLAQSSYIQPKLCLNGKRSSVDFMNVAMGDIPPRHTGFLVRLPARLVHQVDLSNETHLAARQLHTYPTDQYLLSPPALVSVVVSLLVSLLVSYSTADT